MSYSELLSKQEKKAVKELSEKYDEYIAFLFMLALADKRSDYTANQINERLAKIKEFNKGFSKNQINEAYVRSYDLGFEQYAKNRRDLSQRDIDKIDAITLAFLVSLNGMANGYTGKAEKAINQRKLDKAIGIDRRYSRKATMSLRNNKGHMINSNQLAEAYTTAAVWQAGNVGYASSLEKVGVTRVRYKTAEDERVCQVCSPKNDEVYRLPEEFDELPPMHPMCRCYIEPVND